MVSIRPAFLVSMCVFWSFGCSKATFRQAKISTAATSSSSSVGDLTTNPETGNGSVSGSTTNNYDSDSRFPANHIDGRPDSSGAGSSGNGEQGSDDVKTETQSPSVVINKEPVNTTSQVESVPTTVDVDGTQILDVEIERYCKANQQDMLRQSKVNRSSSIFARLYRDRMDQEAICTSTVDYRSILLSDVSTLSLRIPDCGHLETGKYELAFHDSQNLGDRVNKWALRQSSLGYIQLTLGADGRFSLRSNGANGIRLVVDYAANVYYERYGAMYDWLIQSDYDLTPRCDTFWGPEPGS